jgi:hypothetical protein
MSRQTPLHTKCAAASTAGMTCVAINITTMLLLMLMVIPAQADASADAKQLCDSYKKVLETSPDLGSPVCAPGPCPSSGSYDLLGLVADIPKEQEHCAKVPLVHMVLNTDAAGVQLKQCTEACLVNGIPVVSSPVAKTPVVGASPGSAAATPGSASPAVSPGGNAADPACFAVPVATCLLMAMGLLP